MFTSIENQLGTVYIIDSGLVINTAYAVLNISSLMTKLMR